MKEILVTNDDGYEAEGLLELIKALKKIAKVTVVAPATHKSGASHSITITKPLKFVRVDDDFYKLDDATPSDCIYLGIHALFKETLPDLVISGINHGANLAEDITYSGTCGGAMEGTLQGVASLSISQLYIADSLEKYGFDLACEVALPLIEKILNGGFPLRKREFLNLNLPAVSKAQYRGLKIAPAGTKFYPNEAMINKDPRGNEYYWLGKSTMNYDPKINKGSDLEAVFNGYASLTPIMLDMTSHHSLKGLKEWID